MRALDLIGQVFGRLTVVSRGPNTTAGKTTWDCVCECGGRREAVIAGDLKAGRTSSCGCKYRDAALTRSPRHVGERIGRLTVKDIIVTASTTKCECLCDCGKTTTVSTKRLSSGRVQSCGCLRSEKARARAIERNTTHGLSDTTAYITYISRKRRIGKIKRTPAWADQEVIREFYQNCPDGYHVDHIYPLQGRLVSGLHVESNLQYLSAVDNLRKKNKFTPEISSSN